MRRGPRGKVVLVSGVLPGVADVRLGLRRARVQAGPGSHGEGRLDASAPRRKRSACTLSTPDRSAKVASTSTILGSTRPIEHAHSVRQPLRQGVVQVAGTASKRYM